MTTGTFHWLVVQEVRRLLVVRWVSGATLLLCACLVLSVAFSMRDLQEHTVSYEEMLQQRLEAQVDGPARPSGRAAEPGLRVIRLPSPGAAIATGIERALPSAWEFTPAGIEALAPYTRTEVGISGRGVGDVAGLIVGLGGLLAIWLGVWAVVSDRSAGRIAALRALPVSPGTIAVVRLAGGTLAIGVIATVWWLTGWLSIQIFLPDIARSAPTMSAWVVAPVLCYLGLMFALGTLVGAAARDGMNALVTTFMIWMAVVLVVPQIGQLITYSMVEVLPRARMEVARRAEFDGAERLLEQELGVAMATHWPDGTLPSVEQQRVAYLAVGEAIWQAGVVRMGHAAALEEEQWLAQRVRADRLKSWLDAVSPSTWFLKAMAELSGTGRSAEAGWARALAEHDRLLRAQLFENRPKAIARMLWNGEPVFMNIQRHPAPLFSELPPFVDPPAEPGRWTTDALTNLAGLATHTLLAMVAAYISLRSRLR